MKKMLKNVPKTLFLFLTVSCSSYQLTSEDKAYASSKDGFVSAAGDKVSCQEVHKQLPNFVLIHIDELEKLEAETDKETEEMFQEISEYLRKEDGIEQMSMFYIIIGRYFERAADQAFQIAERAIYMATGEKKQLGLAYKRVGTIGPH